MKNIKYFFESYSLEIVLILVVAIVFIIGYIAITTGGQSDFNSIQWVANPANPASPLH